MATLRVFKHYVRISFLLLGLIDFIISLCSVYAGAYIRSSGIIGEPFTQHTSLVVQALVFASVLLISLMAWACISSTAGRFTGLLIEDKCELFALNRGARTFVLHFSGSVFRSCDPHIVNCHFI